MALEQFPNCPSAAQPEPRPKSPSTSSERAEDDPSSQMLPTVGGDLTYPPAPLIFPKQQPSLDAHCFPIRYLQFKDFLRIIVYVVSLVFVLSPPGPPYISQGLCIILSTQQYSIYNSDHQPVFLKHKGGNEEAS